jgi:hypothetical protein
VDTSERSALKKRASKEDSVRDLEGKKSKTGDVSSPAVIKNGEPWRARTSDPLIKSQLLYQLS